MKTKTIIITRRKTSKIEIERKPLINQSKSIKIIIKYIYYFNLRI